MERQDPQLDADRYRVTQPGAGAPGHRRRTGKTGGLNDLRGDRFLDNYRPDHRMAALPLPLVVDIEPAEQRLAPLEEASQGIQQQALAEAPRAREEVVLRSE